MDINVYEMSVTGEVIMSEWKVTDCHILLLNISHRDKDRGRPPK